MENIINKMPRKGAKYKILWKVVLSGNVRLSFEATKEIAVGINMIAIMINLPFSTPNLKKMGNIMAESTTPTRKSVSDEFKLPTKSCVTLKLIRNVNTRATIANKNASRYFESTISRRETGIVNA